jgi:ABC-type multidrug transport system fused ATPase/permease subunit
MKDVGIISTSREFLRRGGPVKALILPHLLAVAVKSILEASPALVVGIVVDQLIGNQSSFLTSPWFFALVAGLSAAYFIVYYAQVYLGCKISETVGVAFQMELFRHLQRLSADFYQRTRVGEITSRLINDMNQGPRQFYSIVYYTLGAVVFLAAACGLMLSFNWRLLVLFSVLGALNYAYANVFIPRVRSRFKALRDTYGTVNAQFVEKINAHALIRAFAREEDVQKEVEGSINKLRDKSFATQHFLFGYMVVSWAFNSVFSPLALIVIGAFFLNKGVTIGNLVTAYAYWSQVTGQLQSLVSGATGIFGSLASFTRITEFFQETPLVRDRPGAPALVVEQGRIALENVTFRYPTRGDKFCISNVSLTLAPRGSVGLVGPSGSGKSTLAHLLLRVYDPAEGRIVIDGQDIAGVTQFSLRSRIGIVTQETMLLDGTIRSNMAFVRGDADEPAIIEALTRAELWDFVSALPEGLDTVVGEKGVRLSGGQRQRLAIARVFLLSPPIVILDEATSSLDALTEASVMQTMRGAIADRTALVIGHRIATVMNTDQIVVLDNGSVIGVGTHAQLYESCDFYRSICIEQRVGAEA